jgi:hypothetical protein
MTVGRARGRRIGAALVGAAVALAGLAQFTGVADAAPGVVTGATLEWSVNDEANAGAFNGDCNYLSAGESDGTAATYRATDRDVTILKRNAAGVYAPVTDHSTRCLDANGVKVAATGSSRLDQRVLYTNGTGTLDPETGEASIQWRGTFTLNFYGSLIPFWITDPQLVVDAAGRGQLVATLGGFASDIDNPLVRAPLDPVPGIVVATFSGVDLRSGGSVTVTPDYAGVTYESTETPQLRIPGTAWGSWPASFVDFHVLSGLSGYWYTTGGLADVRKPPAPITFGLGTVTTPTTGAPTTAAPTTAAPTTAAPTTAAPTTVAPTTAVPTSTVAQTTTTIDQGTTTTTVIDPVETTTTTEPAPLVLGATEDPPSNGDPTPTSTGGAGLALTGGIRGGLVAAAAAAIALGLALLATRARHH